MDKGIFLEPGEGKAVAARGSEMLFKALYETTDGGFSFMERVLPVSNRRPQPHRHDGPERRNRHVWMNCRVIRDREAPGSNPGPPTKT